MDKATTELLMKPADAAKALAISARKLWQLTNRGAIPCVRIGRSVRYSPADLREWIDKIRFPAAVASR